MENDFVNWLIEQMAVRGWDNSELARQASVVPSTISMIVSRQKKPGYKVCIGIGQAFNILPETVLRLAGLLPSLPPVPSAVAEEQEFVQIIRSLSFSDRQALLRMARGLAGSRIIIQHTAPQLAAGLEPRLQELPLDEQRPILDLFNSLTRLASPQHLDRWMIFLDAISQEYEKYRAAIEGDKEFIDDQIESHPMDREIPEFVEQHQDVE